MISATVLFLRTTELHEFLVEFLGFISFVWRYLPVTSFWKILAFPVTDIYSLLGKRDFTILLFDTNFKACLHGGGEPQAGEVTCGGLPHLSCKRDQIKMRDYMYRWVTQPKQVTSPTWGFPPPCKQALRYIWQYILGQKLQVESQRRCCFPSENACTQRNNLLPRPQRILTIATNLENYQGDAFLCPDHLNLVDEAPIFTNHALYKPPTTRKVCFFYAQTTVKMYRNRSYILNFDQ